MIIDSHQHLGRSMFSGVETAEDELLRALDAHGVALALVMPFNLRLAPLEFGAFWSAALVAVGLHLRRLGGETGEENSGPANRR